MLELRSHIGTHLHLCQFIGANPTDIYSTYPFQFSSHAVARRVRCRCSFLASYPRARPHAPSRCWGVRCLCATARGFPSSPCFLRGSWHNGLTTGRRCLRWILLGCLSGPVCVYMLVLYVYGSGHLDAPVRGSAAWFWAQGASFRAPGSGPLFLLKLIFRFSLTVFLFVFVFL